MNERARCLVCESKLQVATDPCERCGARYCPDHRSNHPCAPWFEPWRQLAGALTAHTIEYASSGGPVTLRLFRGRLRYWPGARLLTIAGVSSVRACHQAFRGIGRHSQEVADRLVAVLQMPPLAPVRVEVELAGEDGSVSSSAGILANQERR